MSKLKKKRLSDKMIKKAAGKSKSKNPFEVHINRQKFDVLGKKSKNDRGLPGVARSKSLKKRKETLLQEYKLKDKANRFLDRRIGEKNSAMTSEDRVMARYTAERMKDHSKNNSLQKVEALRERIRQEVIQIQLAMMQDMMNNFKARLEECVRLNGHHLTSKTMFNLADDEILTHRGQSLSEIERFDDPRSDDDDDEFEKKGGGLEASFVGEAHFGGGIFREKEEGAVSRATLIEELIAESKKRKAEKLRAKEQTLELTEKLDSNWHELLPLIDTGKSVANDDDDKPEKQSYDHLMRQLKFESRGKPSDKLKSEEEIAREEKMKLEKLEEERLRRMKGDVVTSVVENSKLKHQSADDLDDGLDLKSDTEEEVSDYEEAIENRSKEIHEDDDDDGDDDDNDNDNEEEEEEEERGDVDSGDNDNEKSDNDEGDDEVYEYEKVDREEIDEEDDNLVITSNKESKSNSSISSEAEHTPQNISKTKCDEASKNTKDSSNVMSEETCKNDVEIPLTPKMPETYDAFQSLMKDFGSKEQAVVVERLIKCYHPSLGENNKQKLESLFTFLLQHLNDADYDDCWKVLNCLAPHLFDLTQFSPENSAHCLMEVLVEKQNDFQAKKSCFPEPETLLFLKLIPLLFPSSDVRHPVVTPAYVFMCQMLNQCKVVGRRDITVGLFLVTTLLEYSSLSKRFCPEAVRFLQGILQMATPGVRVTIPNCRYDHQPLILETAYKETEDTQKMCCSDLSETDELIDKVFQIRSIYLALKLLQVVVDQYAELPAFGMIFKSIKELINKLKITKYPNHVMDAFSKLQTSLNKLYNRKMEFIVSETRRPKALKLYEPMIEKVVDGKKKFGISEEQAEHQKLLAKLRQETKGALREIRRDRQFLTKIKFHEQSKSDAERKRKVRQIYGWGAEQQGELNKMKRKKK